MAIFISILVLIHIIVLFILTIEDAGNTVWDLIFRFSSIILLFIIPATCSFIFSIIDCDFLFAIILIILTIIWIYMNKFTKFKSVKFTNTFIAVILAIFLHLNSYFWTIMRIKGKLKTSGIPIKGVELPYEQIVNIMLFPTLFMTSICALYTAYKSIRLEEDENKKNK